MTGPARRGDHAPLADVAMTTHQVGTPCWHCNGVGRVPIGHRDDDRQCGACDGWGFR